MSRRERQRIKSDDDDDDDDDASSSSSRPRSRSLFLLVGEYSSKKNSSKNDDYSPSDDERVVLSGEEEEKRRFFLGRSSSRTTRQQEQEQIIVLVRVELGDFERFSPRRASSEREPSDSNVRRERREDHDGRLLERRRIGLPVVPWDDVVPKDKREEGREIRESSNNNNAKKNNITNNNNNNNNNRLNALSVEESDVVATSEEEEETRTEKGMAFIAKITNGSIVPSGGLNATNSSGSKMLEKEEKAKKTFSSGGRNKGDQIIGRDNVRIATSEDDFEVVANLRATAFYDDLTERQALPFPPRFTPTFHREFAQRERKALAERVVRPTSACAKCVCLVADDSGEHLVVERLRNSSSAVIGCLDVSIRHNPQSSSTRYQSSAAGVVNTNDSINRYNSGPKTETFVYVDNVAVARRARRRGAAKALLEAASNEAISWGAREMFTHVHCENAAARRLYHAYGFRACVPEVEENVLTGRGEGEDGVTTMTTTLAVLIATGSVDWPASS